MLQCLVIVLFVMASRSLGKNCTRDFHDAEEAILNGSLGVLLNISTAFFPTTEKEAEYLVIRYFYALNCDGGSNHSHLETKQTDYIWASSSVYLVVKPNALEDLTCGIVDVTQGSLYINLQCLCPFYPNDVSAILSRLTAYLKCYAKIDTKPHESSSDYDEECKTNSFIRRYDPHDPLYEKVVDVMNTIKAVSWLSLVLMFFLQLGILNTLYTIILKNHKKYMKRKKLTEPFFEKKSKEKDYLLQKKQNKKKDKKKDKKEQKYYFPMAWATIYIASVLFIVILIRDIDSELADCDSISEHDYKDLYIGVYSTWLVGFVVAIYFPKCTSFPVPVITALSERLDTKLFRMLTFIIQSLVIWILFCLIQLLALHGIFLLVALIAKPVAVLVTLAFVSTFVGFAISGTSVMLEVFSLERINPWSRKAKKFRLYNYLKDLPNFIGSALLSIFILSLMFLTYQFDDKLESTLDFGGAPAAIAGTVHSIFFFIVSIALRKKSFRDIFEKKDHEEEEESEDHEESRDRNARLWVNKLSFWPHKFLYRDCYDDINDDDDDDSSDDDDYTINGK